MRTRWLIVAVVGLSVVAWAKKGGNGGGGGGGGGGTSLTGRVYFEENNTTAEGLDRSMKPDGTSVSSENLPAVIGPLRNMSNVRHGGDYWYLDLRAKTGSNPDGSAPNGIVAMRDDGAGGFDEVELTTPSTAGERLRGVVNVRWGKDDSFVGFISIRWVSGDVEAHLYKAAVTWDSAGEPSLGSEVAVLDLSDELWVDSADLVRLTATGSDWAPGGDDVAISLDGDLIHFDLDAETSTLLDSGVLPIWSPNGAKVAYRDGSESLGGSLYVASISGGSATKLVDKSSIRGVASVIDWTLDSSSISFTHKKRRKGWIPQGLGSEDHNIAIVSASGGSVTLLTNTKNADEYLAGWRSD